MTLQQKKKEVKFPPQFKTAFQLLCEQEQERLEENERRVLGVAA